MKKKWGKGDPVNLSDLLKITPVANEILQLSEELEISTADVMWIVSQIIDNGQEANLAQNARSVNEDDLFDEDWEDIDLEHLEEDMEQAIYLVNIRINGGGRFPEMGFKAGINDRDDIAYFFDMVLEMLDKLE